VTVFLVVTALVNIALGYGLAMYLGHPEWPLRRKAVAGPPVEGPLPEEEEELTVVVGAKPTVTAAAAPMPTPSPAPEQAIAGAPAIVAEAPAASVAATPTATSGEAAAAEPEIEQQMLAGIEEFRNQLAQMKAQPEATATPAGAAAAANA
jgi:hypothetical protein